MLDGTGDGGRGIGLGHAPEVDGQRVVAHQEVEIERGLHAYTGRNAWIFAQQQAGASPLGIQPFASEVQTAGDLAPMPVAEPGGPGQLQRKLDFSPRPKKELS